MWVLPRNISASAQVMKELGLDLEEFGPIAEKSLMWRSKPSLSRTWLQRWKRVKYIRLLSGRMLKPSHTKIFTEKWISSLPGSHVSLSLRQGDRNQQMIQDISIRTSQEESQSADQLMLFSKTSKESSPVKQGMENRYSSMSLEIWKKEIIKHRGEYSLRKKLAHRIRENESLSWPTATASDVRDGRHLRKRTKEWMAKGKVKGIILTNAVESEECQELYKNRANWPTAKFSDAEGGPIQTEFKDNGFRSLRKTSNQWFGAKLRDAVESYEKWKTPTSTERSGINPKTGKGEGLSKQAQKWATPLDRDKNSTGGKNPESWPTPNCPGTHSIGSIAEWGGTGNKIRNPKTWKERLNPNWVEQLMGLKVGWSQLPTEWID